MVVRLALAIALVKMDTNLLERVIASQYDLPDAEHPGGRIV